MIPRIEDRVKLWQQPGPRRWLVFALVGALVALSSILLLSVEEAQAKAKGSPGQDSVEKATGGSGKPAQKDNGGAARPAAGKEPRGKETAKNPAAPGSTPRVDKPAPIDAGPKPSSAERAGKASGEVSGPVLEEVARSADRSVPDKTTSAASPALKEMTSAAEPVLREADNPAGEPALLKEATPAVEPIPGETISTTNPVLGEAAPAIEPVLEKAAPEIGPVLDGAAPPVGPVLEEVTPPVGPVLEPVLDSAAPAVNLIGEAAEPVASPLLEAASPAEIVEPLSEEIVSPTVAPVLEETLPPAGPGLGEAVPPAAPLAEPASDTASPAVGHVAGAAAPDIEPGLEPGFGEVVIPGTGELPTPENNVYAIPAASPAAVPSHAPVVIDVEAWGALPDPRPAPATLGDAQDSSFPVSTDEVRPSSMVGFSRSYLEPFGRSSSIEGHPAVLSDAAVAQGSQDPKPRPGPLGFPSGTPPPAGSSLGGSGSGVALDLLGVLALFLILSRAGRSSWSSLGAFKPNSSLQLAVERPG